MRKDVGRYLCAKAFAQNCEVSLNILREQLRSPVSDCRDQVNSREEPLFRMCRTVKPMGRFLTTQPRERREGEMRTAKDVYTSAC